MSGGGKAVFVDTNALLYCFDPNQPAKSKKCILWVDSLWRNGSGRLSWQVLNEFYYNAAGKLKLSVKQARSVVEDFAQWQPVGFGLGVLHRGWYWMDRAGVSYWDSLIVAAAETAGCAYLLSEDFQTGRKFDGVTVVDPFLSNPSDFGL